MRERGREEGEGGSEGEVRAKEDGRERRKSLV